MSKFVETEYETVAVGTKVVAGSHTTKRYGSNYKIAPYGSSAILFQTGILCPSGQSFHKDDLDELIDDLTAVRDALKD